jgi:putative transposase
MAGVAQRPAAAQHGVQLFRPVDLRWHAGSRPSGVVWAMPRASRTPPGTHRLHHRQPEREKRGKRGARIDPHGFDAGKLIKGKKRHILVDTQGLLLTALVHCANIQDRDGGILLLSTLMGRFPLLQKLFADSAYQGPVFHHGLRRILPRITTDIVRRCDYIKGFVVLPKRWIVERTLAWLNRCRRLAKDWENLNLQALAFLRLASIRLMLRKLCNPS